MTVALITRGVPWCNASGTTALSAAALWQCCASYVEPSSFCVRGPDVDWDVSHHVSAGLC